MSTSFVSLLGKCADFKSMDLPGPSVVKHKIRESVTGAEERCVLKVFAKVAEDNPHIAVDEVVGLVANGTGISMARREVKNGG